MWNLKKMQMNSFTKQKQTHRHRKQIYGNSLAVQWLGLHASTAKGTGSIPGQGTKIPQAVWCSQKTERKKENKLMATKGERGREG